MKTECTDAIEYQELSGRKVISEFNGGYCYLPLYIFCDGYLLCAKLRTSGVDASEGAKEEIGRIVNHIRSQWPGVKIVVRGDSGFAREEIMSWREANQVDYLFGPARNSRLQEEIQDEMEEAKKTIGADRESIAGV